MDTGTNVEGQTHTYVRIRDPLGVYTSLEQFTMCVCKPHDICTTDTYVCTCMHRYVGQHRCVYVCICACVHVCVSVLGVLVCGGSLCSPRGEGWRVVGGGGGAANWETGRKRAGVVGVVGPSTHTNSLECERRG